jgi:hypothetical protein
VSRVAPFLAAFALAACAAQAPGPVAPTRRLGDAMDETGQRFARAGRAVLAGRWELAGYDLHELDEIFSDDLASSSWHGKPALAQLAKRFEGHEVAELAAAVRAHDRAAYEHAVADAARACNGCHRAAEMAYIEIPESLGAEVPNIEPPAPSLAMSPR